MADTVFVGYACDPASGGSQTGDDASIAQATLNAIGCQTGDLLVEVMIMKDGDLPSIASATRTDGGQTWTTRHESNGGGSTGNMNLWVHTAIFNGTWSDDLAWTNVGNLQNTISQVLLVFRNSNFVGYHTDGADTSYSTPSSPNYTVDLNCNVTISVPCFCIGFWQSIDDNTWDTPSAGWTQPSGLPEHRNTANVGASCGFAYADIKTTGEITDPTLNQATLGGDNGQTYMLCWQTQYSFGGFFAVF